MGSAERAEGFDRVHYWPPAAMIFTGVWLPIGSAKPNDTTPSRPDETLTFFNAWGVFDRHFELPFQTWLLLGIGLLALLAAAVIPSAAERVVAKRVAVTACILGIVAIGAGLLTVGPMISGTGSFGWHVDLAAAGWLVTAGGFCHALAVINAVDVE